MNCYAIKALTTLQNPTFTTRQEKDPGNATWKLFHIKLRHLWDAEPLNKSKGLLIKEKQSIQFSQLLGKWPRISLSGKGSTTIISSRPWLANRQTTNDYLVHALHLYGDHMPNRLASPHSMHLRLLLCIIFTKHHPWRKIIDVKWRQEQPTRFSGW